MIRNVSPIFGYLGLGLFGVTAIVQIMYRLFDHFRPFSDSYNIGIGMLLSGFNAILLIFPLLWIIPVCVEFHRLRKIGHRLQLRYNQDEIEQTVYHELSTRLRHCIKIDYIYFAVIILQIIYLIIMWEEVNI